MFKFLRKKLGISHLSYSIEYARGEFRDKLDSMSSKIETQNQAVANTTVIRQVMEMHLALIQHYCPAFEVIKLTNLTSDLIKFRLSDKMVQEEVKAYYFPLGYFRYADRKSNPHVDQDSQDDSDVEEVFEFTPNPIGEELTQEEKDMLVQTLASLDTGTTVEEIVNAREEEESPTVDDSLVTNPQELPDTGEPVLDEHGFDQYGNYHDVEGRS